MFHHDPPSLHIRRSWAALSPLAGMLALTALLGQPSRAADNVAGPWRLNTQGGASAQLAADSVPEALRVSMGANPGSKPWEVQLMLPGVRVTKDARHRIEFRAKAASPRQVRCSVGMNHQPWTSLGLYRELKVGTEWEVFMIDFAATADDENGRLYFDLGGDAADVEIQRASISVVDRNGAPQARLPGDGGSTTGSLASAAPAPLPKVGNLAAPTPIADWTAPMPQWSVFAFQGCAAELKPLDGVAGVRVQNLKSVSNTPWHIRLQQPPTAWQASQRYTLKFKARADQPRKLAVELQQAHEPYRNAGFFMPLEVLSEWRQYQWEFTVPTDEEKATLHFNLGDNTTPLELADFSLSFSATAAPPTAAAEAPAANAANDTPPASVQPAAALVTTAEPATLIPVEQPPDRANTPAAASQPVHPPAKSDGEATLRNGWLFAVAAGSVAELAPVHTVPGGYRVVVLHLEGSEDWRVQLRHALGAVQAGQSVELSLRVRADGPRPMSLGLVSGDAWPKVLGLAEEIYLSPQWQTIERRFTVTEPHASAAWELNFGHSEVSATVADLRLSIDGQSRVGK